METLDELVSRARDRLDELTERTWLLDQLRQWVYDGAKDLARKYEVLRTRSTITATAGTQTYDMPTDVVRVHRVSYTTEDSSRTIPLEYRDFMSMDAVWWSQPDVATGDPLLFTMWGSPPSLQLVCYPTPTDDGMFNVFYYKLPNSPFIDISDPENPVPFDDPGAEIVEVVQGWEDVAVDYAVYMALLRDGNQDWQVYKALYEEHGTDLAVTAIRFSDQAGMIDSDFGSGLVPEFIWNENY